MSGRGAAIPVAHQAREEAAVSWSRIREMSKMKGDLEAAMASALRIKLDRLGEKAWVEECKREMGWSRTTAYRHLNPELMEKNRAAAAAVRANVPTVGTSAPATPAAPAPATAPEPPTNEVEDSEDEKASPLKVLTEADSPLAKLEPDDQENVVHAARGRGVVMSPDVMALVLAGPQSRRTPERSGGLQIGTA